MSTEKCFCHLNGYKVKDADAHKRLTALETQVTALETQVTALETQAEVDYAYLGGEIVATRERVMALENAGGGGFKLYKHSVYEMMDPNDSGAPTATHTIYSFRDTPYTSTGTIKDDFTKGIITSFYNGFASAKVFNIANGNCVCLMGEDFGTDYMGLTGIITNDTVTDA